MNKLHTIGAALCMALVITTGCTFDMLKSRVKEDAVAVPTNTVTTITKNYVTFVRWSLLASSAVNNAKVKWGDVAIAMGNLSTTGDTATTKVLTDGIVAGLVAYATGGASAVAPAVAKLVPADQVESVTDAVMATVEPTAASTVAKARKPRTPAVVPAAGPESAPAPVPIVAKVEPAAGTAGKYLVVVLGNRKGCPLCRGLWKPGFEAEIEKTLLNADVIDADMTDAPKLYKKYYPTEKWVYPYVIVFTPSGERKVTSVNET